MNKFIGLLVSVPITVLFIAVIVVSILSNTFTPAWVSFTLAIIAAGTIAAVSTNLIKKFFID